MTSIDNQSREEIADLYYNRDLNMNLSFANQFDWAMNKLGYHPKTYQSFVENKFKSHVKQLLSDFMENENNSPSNLDLVQIRNHVENECQTFLEIKKQKYQLYSEFFNNNNHRGFYHAMEVSELCYLGY